METETEEAIKTQKLKKTNSSPFETEHAFYISAW